MRELLNVLLFSLIIILVNFSSKKVNKEVISSLSGYIGKNIRLERIINRETKKSIIIPMDHGLTVGPIKGIEKDLGEIVNKIAMGGANAILGHVGIPLYAHRGYGPDIVLILHLSCST